jgi:hypothetical protein
MGDTCCSSLPHNEQSMRACAEGSPAGPGTNSAEVTICTIGGFCGNDPGDLKWLGDKVDSRIAPETSGPLSSQKVDPGVGSSRRTVQEFRTAVMRWARIFMARPAANSLDAANVDCVPDDG